MYKNIFLPVTIAIILMTACNQNSQRDTKDNSKNDYAIVYNVLINDSTDNYDVFAMNILKQIISNG